MKFKRISNNQILSRSSGKGRIGSYFKISKNLGLKVFYTTSENSINKLKKSEGYKFALKELEASKHSKKCPFIMKAHKIEIVQNLKTLDYHAAILVDHICGKEIESFSDNKLVLMGDDCFKVENYQTEINKILEKYKIHHEDLHSGNLLVHKNQVKIIDLDSVLMID